jgi:hypothetical protein
MAEMDMDTPVMLLNLASMVPQYIVLQWLMIGMNGEHAGTGTEGKPGQTVHVSLSRSPDAFAGHPPGYIVVTIDKHAHQCIVPKPHTKEIEECVHDLGHDGAILLSACGGDGGLGGSGGHGQGGGHGRHGKTSQST